MIGFILVIMNKSIGKLYEILKKYDLVFMVIFFDFFLMMNNLIYEYRVK